MHLISKHYQIYTLQLNGNSITSFISSALLLITHEAVTDFSKLPESCDSSKLHVDWGKSHIHVVT